MLIGASGDKGRDSRIDEGLRGLGNPSSDRRRLAGRRGADKLLILLLPTAFFFYESSRPIMRLKLDMPSRFIDFRNSAGVRQQAEEREVALEYWNCGVAIIQWKYPYGTPLPLDPPPELKAYGKSGEVLRPLRANDQGSDARVRYWKRFRQMWVSPDAWKTSREWSTSWLTDPLLRLIDRFDDYFRDVWRVS